MAKFQTGGMRVKAVTANLFILRSIIDHSKYLEKELWISFYDIEKCFDSLWPEDCMSSLWNCGVRNDVLYLIYLLNRNADTIVKTPFGDTGTFTIPKLVKQGTILGQIVNNCSLGEISDNGQNYQYGEVKIFPLESVDDIADINDGIAPTVSSNSRICHSQDLKRLKFAHEKCKLLKINTSDQQQSLQVNGQEMEVKDSFRYLGDIFSFKGDNIGYD